MFKQRNCATSFNVGSGGYRAGRFPGGRVNIAEGVAEDVQFNVRGSSLAQA